MAVCRQKIRRLSPKIVQGRTFKRFNQIEYIRDMENAPWSVCSVFDDPDDSYWAWVTEKTSEDKKPVPSLGHTSDTPPESSV